MSGASTQDDTIMQVHMREMSPEGEEVIRVGKLYLVDLAGSENVNRQATCIRMQPCKVCIRSQCVP